MSYVKVAADYADQVISGEIPACAYVKSACQRFVDDLTRDFDYHLDIPTVDRWCSFLERLPHTKGRWAAKSERLKLQPWQVFLVVNIFGWLDESGNRRFREVYVEVPRKNGKSLLVAGIGLGMLVLDGEFSAEVLCGAATESQAMHVFGPARAMCRMVPDLAAKYKISVAAKSLYTEADGGKFQPLVGDPGDGANCSCGIADEFHEHPNSNLVDTLVTGMGSRNSPLMIYITTAGQDVGGPCFSKREDVTKILKGTVEDDSIFGVIYTIDTDDEWASEDVLRKANPNYGISVSEDFLKGQLKQARRSAIRQAAYKTKHLNVWVGAKAAWMNMLAFQACRKHLNIDNFRGRKCFVALDLASKIDLAAMAILFPGESSGDVWTVFCKHYLPEEAIFDERSDRYAAWHADGWMTTTPGNVIDYEYIEEDLKSIAKHHQVVEVPYDPFQATQFSQRMLKEGLPMVEYGATVKNFSEPMKELESKVLSRSIQFDMDPVLFWAAGNVCARLDLKDNIFPNKVQKDSSAKIDPIVATIMAMARALFHERETTPYEDHDLYVVDL